MADSVTFYASLKQEKNKVKHDIEKEIDTFFEKDIKKACIYSINKRKANVTVSMKKFNNYSSETKNIIAVQLIDKLKSEGFEYAILHHYIYVSRTLCCCCKKQKKQQTDFLKKDTDEGQSIGTLKWSHLFIQLPSYNETEEKKEQSQKNEDSTE